MKRFGMTTMLKDEVGVIEKYEKYHNEVWPEVVEASKKVGIRRVFIYRMDRQLFMFMETTDDFDMERDFAKYMESSKVQEWEELMRTFQVKESSVSGCSQWMRMEEVCALDYR